MRQGSGGRWLAGGALCLVVAGLAGCGRDTQGAVLVRVGDVRITEADLREYRAGLSKALQPTATGEAAVRDLLSSLVNRQLMVQEASALGYDRDSTVVGRLERYRVQRLAGMVIREQIAGDVSVSEEEIQRTYRDDRWDQQHRPAHILNATEAQARETIELLRQGRDFAQVARERSLRDGERGGDLGQYFGPDDVATEIGRVVLGVPAGEVVGPIHTRDGYEVIKILDVQPVPLESVRAKVRGSVFQRKFMLARERYLEELESKYRVAYRRPGIDAIVAAGRSGGSLDPAQESLPVLTWQGRDYTAAEVQPLLLGPRRPAVWSADSANVVWALRMQLLADSLLVADARERGLETKPDFVAYLRERQEALLVETLRRRQVLDRIEPSEVEVEQLYASDPEAFRVPPMAEVTEIVVTSEALARQLRTRVQGGADMAALVRQYTVRPGAIADGGRLRFYEGQKAQWGPLYDPLLKAAVGDVLGPFQVERWWGIYRVDRRVPGRQRPLSEVRDQVVLRYKRAREPEGMAAYMEGLRARYKDRIEWYDRRIAELVASGAFDAAAAAEPKADPEAGT